MVTALAWMPLGVSEQFLECSCICMSAKWVPTGTPEAENEIQYVPCTQGAGAGHLSDFPFPGMRLQQPWLVTRHVAYDNPSLHCSKESPGPGCFLLKEPEVVGLNHGEPSLGESPSRLPPRTGVELQTSFIAMGRGKEGEMGV